MGKHGTIQVGANELTARKLAGRWTASVNGRTMSGFFGSEAQAFGAALVALTNREREIEVLAQGETLSCEPPRRSGGP